MIFFSTEKLHFALYLSVGLLSLPLLTECDKIRLVGPSRCSGRVEVNHRDSWGTVCDDQWSIVNAGVVCRELNCGTVLEAKKSAFFGQGKDEIWLDDVQCTGNEASILKCQHRPLGQNKCDHDEDAGVVCSEHVRVVDGSNRCNGRVEIFHNNQWKRACSSDWGKEEAYVLCEEINCGTPADQAATPDYGEARDLLGVKTTCFGNETSLSQCKFQELNESCVDATVLCTNSKPLRLMNGTNRCSGRVEVDHDGQWGTVCDDRWGMQEAVVACRQMNCGNALAVKYKAFFGRGQEQVWLDDIDCTGHEKSLTDCPHRGLGEHDCDHSEDVGVICSENVRLINGADQCSGRLEVFHDGQWGKICTNNWGIKEATLVCKELSCGAPKKTPESFSYGESGLRSFISTCSGNVSSISQCTLQEHSGTCEGVSVSCAAQIRLVGGLSECSGRVEILYEGQWGTVCDDEWEMSNANVVCRQLGCGHAVSVPTRAHFGVGSGPIWLDNVECSGQETVLTHCKHPGFGANNCDHIEDAGVICSGTVRLVNGTDQCSGRLEVFHDGQWEKICTNNWGIKEATLVCKELSCGAPNKPPESFSYGESGLRSFISTCSGNVSSVSQCTLQEHSGTCEGVSVSCAGISRLRLVNGTDRCSGRVEVLHDGQWGTVCDDQWDIREAQVVCRAMDCGSPQRVKPGAFFGKGQGAIWLDDVNCFGNETSLVHCQHPYFGENDCGHGEDAGVVCSATIRLINRTDQCSGRVELYYNNNWSPAYNVNWGMNEATVVCREINCGDPVKVTGSFGQSGDRSGYKISCTGRESSITQCTVRNYPRTSNDRIEEAAVVCSGNVKISNGPNQCAGRVEFYDNGHWGTICGEYWDMNDAMVVCRQLNCGKGHKITTMTQYGQGTGPNWIDQIECSGSELALAQCPQRAYRDRTCNTTSLAGVVCTGSLEVRLANGKDECSGRVEVRRGDVWSTVCDTYWTMSKAEVVCELLECGHAVNAPGGASFGQGIGPVVEATGSCFDNVTSLSQCSLKGFKAGTCGHEHDASVLCAAQIRLVGGLSECSGRVEILYKGQWGTVCDDEWEMSNANVVCRQLGCGHAVSAPTRAHFGGGSGPIWLDNVECSGQETALTQCKHPGLGANNCGHSRDAGVICSGTVRLVNGTDQCSGRLEVFHDGQWEKICTNSWGIKEATLVCKELICGAPNKPPESFSYGESGLRSFISTCSGNVSSISQCTLQEHSGTCEGVSVSCAGISPLRLVNGPDRCSGRVEVLHDDKWGTVCDDQWDIREAQVVCRAMDCGSPQTVKPLAFFGKGQGAIWLNDVNCFGNETSLVHCQHPAFGKNNCGHGEDAGVVCSATIRLINGTDQCSGRVELYYNNNWSPAYNVNWGMNEATVVCREMNCGDPVKVTGSFGQSGDRSGYKISCTGRESSITQCTVRNYPRTSNDRIKEAAVVCSGNVKISNGPNQCAGRVEFYDNGHWGTICGEYWDMNDAMVVCRQLNCGKGHKITTMTQYGQGTGPKWVDQIECSGSELTLAQCPQRAYRDRTCNTTSLAGVVCTGSLEVRLANGKDECSGRVEVRRGDVWSTVCDTYWTMSKAEVVCELLECGRAVNAPGGASFGQGIGPVVEATGSCFDNVTSLSQCSLKGFKAGTCGHEHDAGVLCAAQIRLVGGSSECSGRVEILYKGQWGTVCDDEWEMSNADVVCRQLGCGHAVSAPTRAHFGGGSGPIWLDNVECSGQETVLTHCKHRGFGVHNCGHGEDAGVICLGALQKPQISLSPGPEAN